MHRVGVDAPESLELRMVMSNEPASVLVATVGGQPQIITLSLDWLLGQGYPIGDVVPIYLPGPHSRSQRGLERIQEEFVREDYRGRPIRVRPCAVRSGELDVGDVRDESDAEAVWQTLYELLGQLKQQDRHVHLCVSGGRRMMALQAISAAMLHFGRQDRVWHIFMSNEFEARAREGAIMHAAPGDEVRLIEVPFMPWGAYFPGLQELARVSSQQVIASRVKVLDRAEQQRRQAVLARLSPRETDVLRAFAEGLKPQEVAAKLSIDVRTVNTHKTEVLAECRVQWGLPEDYWLDYRFIREKFGE
jgi:CRISPR-associated protein Csx14